MSRLLPEVVAELLFFGFLNRAKLETKKKALLWRESDTCSVYGWLSAGYWVVVSPLFPQPLATNTVMSSSLLTALQRQQQHELNHDALTFTAKAPMKMGPAFPQSV